MSDEIDEQEKLEERRVRIAVSVTTYAEYILKTTKSADEVLKDIENRGVGITDDDDYKLVSYEINAECAEYDLRDNVLYEVEGIPDEFELPFKDDGGYEDEEEDYED